MMSLSRYYSCVGLALLLLSFWLPIIEGFVTTNVCRSQLITTTKTTRRSTTKSSLLTLTSDDGNDGSSSNSLLSSTTPVAENGLMPSTTLVVEEQPQPLPEQPTLRPWQSLFTRLGMISYIVAMCIALPITLLPQKLMYKYNFLIHSRTQKEEWATATSTFCARWLLRFIPFCKITTYAHHIPNPQESIWVCNHTSMLDIFLLLASDRQARGRTRRKIKIVYWKQLENNIITKLLFKQAGFIPVQMSANNHGEDNDYDRSSFKQLIKDAKQAFQDGFDIGILPEGQLNPTPEKGLLPIFSGAYSLAKMSKRPVFMLALQGAHDLWHPMKGMHCLRRHVQIRVYPYSFRFTSANDFVTAFTQLVGHFAIHGKDLDEEQLAPLVARNILSS